MDPEVLDLLEKALEEEECEEMNLDELKIGTFTDEFVKKLSKIDHLGDLTMNNCKITSLAGFPTSLPLVRLELNDNHFEGSDLKYLSQLSTLSLMNNRITEYSQLEPLTKLEKLIQLDLSECPIAREPEYRGKLFSMFSHLEILDNKDVDNQSVDYDEEGDAELAEGEFGEEEEYDDEGDEEDFNEDEDEEDSDAARPSKKLKK